MIPEISELYKYRIQRIPELAELYKYRIPEIAAIQVEDIQAARIAELYKYRIPRISEIAAIQVSSGYPGCQNS